MSDDSSDPDVSNLQQQQRVGFSLDTAIIQQRSCETSNLGCHAFAGFDKTAAGRARPD
jgi:hypothetical protein